jgi:hypothetical protein
VTTTPVFNPAPPLAGSFVRSTTPGIVTAERNNGDLLVVQPVEVGTRAMKMVGIGVWWQRLDGYHLPSPRKSCLVHVAEVPALIEALKALQAIADGPSAPDVSPKKSASSYQDQALLLLANGYGPRDLQKQLWPFDAPNPRRLTELGKALRRARLLIPGDWDLTPEGQARVMTLKRAKGETQGERWGDPPEQDPSFLLTD